MLIRGNSAAIDRSTLSSGKRGTREIGRLLRGTCKERIQGKIDSTAMDILPVLIMYVRSFYLKITRIFLSFSSNF